MAVMEINWSPSRRDLLMFGRLQPAFAALVGGMLYWRFHAHGLGVGIWLGGGAISALYFLIPPIRRPLYIGWMCAAFPIGFAVSHVVFAAMFYLIITPIGVVMRLLGRDPMERAFDPEAKSYWVEHDPHRDPAQYFRQF